MVLDGYFSSHTEDDRPFAVFRRSDVLEVVGTPIEDIAVEVVNLHRDSIPFGRDNDRSRSEPRECHQFVTELFVIPPHDGIDATTPAVVTMPTRGTHGR